LVGFAIGARVALLWQHNANPSYKLASIPRYDDIVLTAGWAGSARAAGRRPAGDGGRPQNRAPHTGSGCGRPAADGGVLNITAAVWTAGFHWWRSGNKKRTQNVCEYMLVLALCLVDVFYKANKYKHQRISHVVNTFRDFRPQKLRHILRLHDYITTPRQCSNII